MKHIGILAHSAEGASLCYLSAVHEGSLQLGEHTHPDITLDSIPFGQTMPFWEKEDFEGVRGFLMASAKRLAKAGCDFFVCPDNTGHLALEAGGDPFPIPALHIAGVVAEKANEKGFKKIGILGTKWIINGPLYRNAFSSRGMDFAIPGEDDTGLINRAIFDELCNGIFRDETRSEFVRIISDLKNIGCDAVVLACTEIPIIITPENSPLPTLDSTRLLAMAAVEVALGNQPVPTWVGGHVFSKA